MGPTIWEASFELLQHDSSLAETHLNPRREEKPMQSETGACWRQKPDRIPKFPDTKSGTFPPSAPDREDPVVTPDLGPTCWPPGAPACSLYPVTSS